MVSPVYTAVPAVCDDGLLFCRQIPCVTVKVILSWVDNVANVAIGNSAVGFLSGFRALLAKPANSFDFRMAHLSMYAMNG